MTDIEQEARDLLNAVSQERYGYGAFDMTEPTEEARAELDAINDALSSAFGSNLAGDYANAIMLALDKHHGRTPPDPVTQWLHKSGWEGNAVAEHAVRDYLRSKNDG